jgi:hypothetical protein
VLPEKKFATNLQDIKESK